MCCVCVRVGLINDTGGEGGGLLRVVSLSCENITDIISLFLSLLCNGDAPVSRDDL